MLDTGRKRVRELRVAPICHDTARPGCVVTVHEDDVKIRDARREQTFPYKGKPHLPLEQRIGFGESGYALLKTIPEAVVGGLLLFSGLELALSSKPQEYRDADLFLVLLMAAIGVALNPVAAFVVGLPLAYAFKQKWLRI
jgi:hypothetical protein